MATAFSGRGLLLSLRLLRLARPPALAAPLGPGEPGRLSGWRRLSATLASRGARRPGTSVTPRTPLCPVPPSPLHFRRDARAATILLFLPEGKERREPRPLPPGSGLEEEEEAEAEGSARHSRQDRVSPPGWGRGCQLLKSSGGGGRRGSRSFLAMERRSRPEGAQSSVLSLWTSV